MRTLILRRLVTGVGVIWSVVTITFVALHLAPGNPATLIAGPAATPAQLAALRAAWGLDRPVPAQYVAWLGRFVTGDWGVSLTQGRPVVAVFADALGPTLLLVGGSLLVSYVAGTAIGVWQAHQHRSWWDTGLSAVTVTLYGLPSYWLALILIMVFAFYATVAGWPVFLRFPAFGMSALDAEFLAGPERFVDRLRHLALPLTTLSVIGAAGIARYARGATLDARREAYVLSARARGLRAIRVELRHVLRNALLPLVTLLGLNLPALVSGAVFVEAIFAWPGMGRVIVEAVGARDYPVVMASTALFALLVVIGNTVADLTYALVDPRVRRDGS